MVIKYEELPKCRCFCIDGSTNEEFRRELVSLNEIQIEARYASKQSINIAIYTEKHSRRVGFIPDDCKDLKFRVVGEYGGLDFSFNNHAYFKILKSQGKKEFERYITSVLKGQGVRDDVTLIIMTDVKEWL